MAILGRDGFGRINSTVSKQVNPEETEDIEESIDMPIEQIDEEPAHEQSPGASLEYLDRMREIKNRGKTPIGNQLQSDAKAFDSNSRFSH